MTKLKLVWYTDTPRYNKYKVYLEGLEFPKPFYICKGFYNNRKIITFTLDKIELKGVEE
jgi:hypothetical protein